MMTKLLSCRNLLASCSAVFLGVSPICVCNAGSEGKSASAVEAQAEFEIAQRRQLAGDFAPQAMARGTEALAVRDYAKAFSEYRAALDAIPNAPETHKLHSIAMDGFTKAAMGLAEQRIAEGRWEDAQTTVAKLLEYNPNYQPGRKLLQRLQSPDYFNKTVTPGFVSRVEQVKSLLVEAQGLYDSGRFEEATKKYESVLRIDRFNIAARRGMEQIDLARTRVAEAAYDHTRAALISEVDKGWETRVAKVDSGDSAILEQPAFTARGSQFINRKLDEIIIPKLTFTDTTIRDVVNEIANQAAKYDDSSDAAERGVNIVLKLEGAAEAQTITLDLTNVPLREALDYVTRLANLKFKVDPYAVLVVPVSTETDVFLTKEYKVPPGFITSMPSSPPEDSATTGQSTLASSGGAKELLEGNGVEFPPGASANFLPNTGRLIVRNTQANLDLVDALVSSQAGEDNQFQVEIESKFVEVSQDNLKELGFDWLLGQFAFPGGSGIYGGGGTPGNQADNSQTYPFTYPGTTPTVPVGVNPITAGNRTGAAAISANALDSLLLGNPVTGPASGVLALAGIFTNPQFQVVLRALNQKKGIDLLSAPKVTTKSGYKAKIEIVRVFRYPSQYAEPRVPGSSGGGVQPITPASPTEFESRDLGVILEVEPTVGADKTTIDLRLVPQVTEFEGFINYGTPIYNGADLFGRPIEATPNVINYPVFNQRSVETAVSVYDGQTVVLGGLMREDVQKVTDKTPVLGDIPLVGSLFRSQADKHIKRNLIIFVTPRLLDPAGQPWTAAGTELMSQAAVLPGAASTSPSLAAPDPVP